MAVRIDWEKVEKKSQTGADVESTTLTIHMQNLDGSKIMGRSMREMVTVLVASDGMFCMYLLGKPIDVRGERAPLVGRAADLQSAKRAVMTGIADWICGIKFTNRKAVSYGPASGGVIAEL